jgi:hypothetical protein
MMKPKQVCQFCEKKFKRVAGHYAFCKVGNRPPQQPVNLEAIQNAKLEGAKMNADSQAYRGREAIISMSEAVAKLNQAFATVIGEWRF